MNLSKQEVRDLFNQVKENHGKLNACVRHVFKPTDGNNNVHTMYRCDRCGGEISRIHHTWWKRGFDDGGKASFEHCHLIGQDNCPACDYKPCEEPAPGGEG